MINWQAVLFMVALCVIAFISIQQAHSAEDYYEVNVFMGQTKGNDWDNAGELGSGFGIGYHRRLWGPIWGTAQALHYSQLMAGTPIDHRHESYMNHIGLKLEWRFGE